MREYLVEFKRVFHPLVKEIHSEMKLDDDG